MPLWRGQPYSPSVSTLGLANDVEVLLLRFTGEIFTDFEEYSRKLSWYRKRDWSCQLTGKAGLTYEEALVSEAKSKGLLQQVPECYEEPLLRFVHHAIGTADDLESRLLAEFQDRIMPGEELSARAGDKVRPCQLIALENVRAPPLPDGVDGEPGLDEAPAPPPLPQQEATVLWLDVKVPKGGESTLATLPRDALIRPRPPLSRALVSQWLRDNASAEEVANVKGVPALWRASPEQCERYGLPAALPKGLAKRLAAPQKPPKEPKPPPAPKDPAEPKPKRERPAKKAKKTAEEVPTEVTLSLKAEAAAIAAAAFADAAAMVPAAKDEPAGKKRKRKPKPLADVDVGTAPDFPPEPDEEEAPATPGSGGVPAAAESGPAAAAAAGLRLEDIPGIRVESLEETEARLADGSVKQVLFRALRDAGPDGLDTGAMAAAVAASGVRTWDQERIAKSSCASTCIHDPAFARVEKGRFALRVLRPDLEDISVNAIIQRAANRKQTLSEAAVRSTPGETSGQGHKNSFKCSRCQRMHHVAGSPLLLCDTCPRSVHLACLDLDYGQLPPGNWSCPKCAEKGTKAANQIRRSANKDRAVLTEKEKEERRLKRAVEKAERQLAKIQQREDKELSKLAEKDAKKEAPKPPGRAQKPHITDDVLVEEDEKENLRKAEERVKTCAAEAAFAAEMGLQMAQQQAGAVSEGEPLPEPGAEEGTHVAALQERQREAEEKVARLSKMIAGPLIPEPVVTGAGAHASLMDALAVAEFLAAFGDLCEAPVLSLAAVQRAAARPLGAGGALGALYAALLRCVLLEKVGQEGLMRSRARRWARVMDEATWPEVLRRYLLVSRAALPRPDQAAAPDQAPEAAALLDDDAASVRFAGLLAERPFYEIEAPLHLRLLATLCNDVANGAALRAEFTARIEEATALQTQHRQLLIDEKKEDRQKQEAAAAAEAASAHADAGAFGKAEEGAPQAAAPAEDGNGGGDKNGVLEEERERREAEFEEALRARAVRSDLLGRDRAFRRYWWLQGEHAALWVEEPDGSALALIGSEEALEGVLGGLNRRGLRERALLAALKRRQAALLSGMRAPVLKFTSDIAAVPKLPTSKVDKMASSSVAATIRAACEQVDLLVDEVAAQQAVLATSYQDWHARMAGVAGVTDLAAALRDLESELNVLGDGLPRGAKDEQLRPLLGGAALPNGCVGGHDGPEGAKAGAPSQPETAAAAAPANDSPDVEMTDAAEPPAAAAPSQDRDAAAGGSSSGDGLQGEPTPEDPPRGDDAEDDNGGDGGEGTPAEPDQASLAWVTPVDELDNSDVEAAQRDSRRIGLWRSARERAVWLLDLQAVSKTGSLAEAAYSAVVLRDRMQPLLHRLAKRLARAAAQAEGAAAAEEAAAMWEEEQRQLEAREKGGSAAAPSANGSGAAGKAGPTAKTGAEKEKKAAAAEKPAKKAAKEQEGGKGGGEKTKLKFKLKVGGVAVDGAKKGGKKASRPPSPDADGDDGDGGAGGGSAEPETSGRSGDDDDRWGFECFRCGQDGDLLCCEAKRCRVVMHPRCVGLPGIPQGRWFCPDHADQAKKKKPPKPKGEAKAKEGKAAANAQGEGKAKQKRERSEEGELC